MNSVRFCLGFFLSIVSAALFAAPTSEITVNLKLDASDFVLGERVRAVLDIANYSPDVIGTGGKVRVWGGEGTNKVLKSSYNVNDKVLIEVYRSTDSGLEQLTRISRHEFVSPFAVETGEGQKLEVFLADHYALDVANRFVAKPVLVHAGTRYEGLPRVFDMVEGVNVTEASQLFQSRKNMQRDFSVVYWPRANGEHLFLKARDTNPERTWRTTDLGYVLRITKPIVSVCKDGRIFVLHRLDQDRFVRTEFWSLPDDLEFRGRSVVLDPVTAGTQSVRELYRDGGVKPRKNPWWKFW